MKMKFAKSLLFFAAFAVISGSQADDQASDRVLSYDPRAGIEEALKFPVYTEDDTEPTRSDFGIERQVFLSSKIGDRRALITLTNHAAGSRIFDSEYIVGVFANGDKQFPLEADFQVRGGKTISYMFSFGRHDLPLLYVYTRN